MSPDIGSNTTALGAIEIMFHLVLSYEVRYSCGEVGEKKDLQRQVLATETQVPCSPYRTSGLSFDMMIFKTRALSQNIWKHLMTRISCLRDFGDRNVMLKDGKGGH